MKYSYIFIAATCLSSATLAPAVPMPTKGVSRSGTPESPGVAHTGLAPPSASSSDEEEILSPAQIDLKLAAGWKYIENLPYNSVIKESDFPGTTEQLREIAGWPDYQVEWNGGNLRDTHQPSSSSSSSSMPGQTRGSTHPAGNSGNAEKDINIVMYKNVSGMKFNGSRITLANWSSDHRKNSDSQPLATSASHSHAHGKQPQSSQAQQPHEDDSSNTDPQPPHSESHDDWKLTMFDRPDGLTLIDSDFASIDGRKIINKPNNLELPPPVGRGRGRFIGTMFGGSQSRTVMNGNFTIADELWEWEKSGRGRK